MTSFLFLVFAGLFCITLFLFTMKGKPAPRRKSKPGKIKETLARPVPTVSKEPEPEPASAADPESSAAPPPDSSHEQTPPPADPALVVELTRQIDETGYATLHNVYFYPGSEELRDTSWPELRAVAALFQGIPGLSLRIDGSSNGNEKLALRRAISVSDYLRMKCAIHASRIQTSGRMIGGGNKERNRKVQIIRTDR